MGWLKRPRRAPIDLGTTHLDEVVTPDEYTQIFASRATKAQGYPFEGIAGHMKILPWNPANGAVIAVFTTWTGGIAKRTYYQGSWRAWVDPMGKAVP